MGDRSLRELERAIESGERGIAETIARECSEASLELALGLLPIAAVNEPGSYDERARAWLVRWIVETPQASIGQVAELARALTHVPADPSAMDAARDIASQGRTVRARRESS
jgi:hypothetical protein